MSEKKTNLKSIIRDYILTIGGLLKEDIKDPKFYCFWFYFTFTWTKYVVCKIKIDES